MGYTHMYGILYFERKHTSPMGTFKDIITTNNQKVLKE